MYQTFMNAYTLVDAQTRRKLDEMLKTWKEPVPGSLDTRPVFAPEITRSIESALIKARTAALQQEQARGSRDILNRGRGNGTPPGLARPANNHHGTNGQGYGTPVRYSGGTAALAIFDSLTTLLRQTPPQGHRPGSELEALNRDLEACILSARSDFAAAPFDPTSQQRLKALLDLQTIMRNQQLTPEQLRLVRDQISVFRPQAPAAQNPVPTAPPAAVPAPAAAPVPPPAPVPTPPTQPASQPLQNLLNSRTLAELIKNTAIRQQPTPPPAIPNAMPPMPPMPQMASATNTPQPDNPLIAALRARGILPPASAPPAMGGTGTLPTGESLPFLVPGGMLSTPPVPTPPVSMPVSSAVPLSTASMKM